MVGKKIIGTIVGLTLLMMSGKAVTVEVKPETVLGTWMVPKKDAKITISKCGDAFCGKITWLLNPEDLDIQNPDKGKQKEKILGQKILRGFKYDDNEWTGGKIYDPDSGKTYSCKMWMKSNDKLNVKGYVLVSLFGRSEIWTRVK